MIGRTVKSALRRLGQRFSRGAFAPIKVTRDEKLDLAYHYDQVRGNYDSLAADLELYERLVSGLAGMARLHVVPMSQLMSFPGGSSRVLSLRHDVDVL